MIFCFSKIINDLNIQIENYWYDWNEKCMCEIWK